MGDHLSEYITVKNLKQVEVAFRSYMAHKHRIEFSEDDGAVRQRLYNVMVDLKDRHGGDTSLAIKDMNNLALNIARDLVLREQEHPTQASQLQSKQQQQQGRRLNVRGLERDKDVFGDRTVAFSAMMPGNSEGNGNYGNRDTVAKAFDAIVDERTDAPKAPLKTWNDVGKPTMQVDAMAGDEFTRRMSDLADEREKQWVASREMMPPPPDSTDPQAVMRLSMQEQEEFKEMQRIETHMQPLGRGREDVIIPLPASRMTVERFIGINGFNRDVRTDPYRHKYTVNVTGQGEGGLHGTYRNVEWMSATSIVLPMEIIQTGNIKPKQFFNQGFSFSYPYLLLRIEGFDGVYDGTNEAMRRAFCMFVFHRSYKAPNGRGYVLLEPAQKERKVFTTPLASLRDLTVSLIKPNGTLFNNSMDNTRVSMLQYEVQQRLYIKVVCDTYFDRNEFYPGDTVMLRGFVAAPPIDPAPDTDIGAYAVLNEFVNRQQGHELVQLGAPNDQGFFKTFSVLAPGVLDQGMGRVITDGRLLTAVQSLTRVTSPATVTSPGLLLNMSLQNVIMLRVGTQSTDPSSVMTPLVVL